MSDRTRWDIFCRIVDNYGDGGFCLRLARMLVREHALDVTLWLDDLGALARIAHGVDAAASEQAYAGITLRRWDEPFALRAIPHVVIEAFGCGLPDRYVAAMAATASPPRWFILEYLSAEAWIEVAHGGSSPHPRLSLERRFWFPGFTPRSGGLLRESGLLQARELYLRDPDAESAFWASLQVPPIAHDEVRLSLFCYPNAALPALLDAWADGDVPISCIVPEGIAEGAFDAWTSGDVPHFGRPHHRGRLWIYAIPFLDQDQYDRLLWLCRVNFVRGEDSFVRAQWAAHPFVWHVYPQAEGTHWRKQSAFLDRYADGLAPDASEALRAFWNAWNGAPEAADITHAWQRFAASRARLESHGALWSKRLAELPELARGLVIAAQLWV